MAGSFTGLPAGSIEAQRGGCPLIRSCIHYHILWLSRFASRQHDLSPLIGKHLRNWHRGFYRSLYMRSHRRYSSTEDRKRTGKLKPATALGAPALFAELKGEMNRLESIGAPMSSKEAKAIAKAAFMKPGICAPSTISGALSAKPPALLFY